MCSRAVARRAREAAVDGCHSCCAASVLGTGNAPTGWRVDALNGTGVQNNLVAIAVCVSP